MNDGKEKEAEKKLTDEEKEQDRETREKNGGKKNANGE